MNKNKWCVIWGRCLSKRDLLAAAYGLTSWEIVLEYKNTYACMFIQMKRPWHGIRFMLIFYMIISSLLSSLCFFYFLFLMKGLLSSNSIDTTWTRIPQPHEREKQCGYQNDKNKSISIKGQLHLCPHFWSQILFYPHFFRVCSFTPTF